MKRDWDLIRSILLFAEKKKDKIPFYDMLPMFDVDADTLNSHLRLMQDMNLIRYGGSTIALTPETRKYDGCYLYRITAGGYDYLDTVRSNLLWTKAKEKILSSGEELTITAVKSVISKLIESLFRN